MRQKTLSLKQSGKLYDCSVAVAADAMDQRKPTTPLLENSKKELTKSVHQPATRLVALAFVYVMTPMAIIAESEEINDTGVPFFVSLKRVFFSFLLSIVLKCDTIDTKER